MPTYDKKQYFVTLIDDYKKYIWTRLIHSKGEVLTILTDFVCLIKNQFNASIKILRSDKGSEFFNTKCADFLASHGVIHQSSCPYTPQQNGTVERKNKYIIEVARAL